MARNTSIGAYHFSANPALFEIQRSNNFELVVDASLNNVQAYNSETKTFPNAQEYLRLSIASSSAPHYSQNPIEIRRGNTGVKYAGVMTFGSGTMVFRDFIGTNTLEILQAWQALSGNPINQTVGRQAEYKKDCTLIEYSSDYNTVIRTYRMVGCWISSISESDFSQDDSGARNITCNIEYDYAEILEQ